jgi:hypothetical protein
MRQSVVLAALAMVGISHSASVIAFFERYMN